jgi:amidase
MELGPYGFYRNGGPHWGNWRCLAPVRDGLIHFPPDFVVPVRPMIGVIQLATWASSPIDSGGNMDFNSICPGSTVHIRAQKPGAYLSLGDVHARMGDGELTGAGVEIDSAITKELRRTGQPYQP